MPHHRTRSAQCEVLKRAFDARVIALVALAGITEGEAEAEAERLKIGKILSPCVAWDRSVSLGRNESTTKVLFSEQTARVLGAGIVGPNASDLLAEVTVAIERGCDATGIGQCHPPPTRPSRKASNSPLRCSRGTITDLIPPNRES